VTLLQNSSQPALTSARCAFAGKLKVFVVFCLIRRKEGRFCLKNGHAFRKGCLLATVFCFWKMSVSDCLSVILPLAVASILLLYTGLQRRNPTIFVVAPWARFFVGLAVAPFIILNIIRALAWVPASRFVEALKYWPVLLLDANQREALSTHSSSLGLVIIFSVCYVLRGPVQQGDDNAVATSDSGTPRSRHRGVLNSILAVLAGTFLMVIIVAQGLGDSAERSGDTANTLIVLAGLGLIIVMLTAGLKLIISGLRR
jgi:hypothetical protein